MSNPPLEWRRSRRCEAHACLEVAFAQGMVLVRHSHAPAVPPLRFTEPAWRAFCDMVKRGQLRA